ncbi:hypothetical protein GRAN_2528 [Granulicella sibirica]|uniref:Uncharacterized protein n=1 Tax=Granulicella sibirica TaxID=2479048 RepID=A0A4Q0T288_9BACT|nr:hypothetical protein GRAN_2528 [Granulicella sibirica]
MGAPGIADRSNNVRMHVRRRCECLVSSLFSQSMRSTVAGSEMG